MIDDEKTTKQLKLLSDPVDDVRINAIRSLDQSATPKIIDFLIQMLNDDSQGVRLNAASALARLKVSRAAQSIGLLISGESKSIREEIAEILSEFGESGFIVLKAGLQSENPQVRLSSVYGLADCPCRRSVDCLINALQDPDKDVRSNAAQSLGDLSLRARQTYINQAVKPLILAFQRPQENEEVLDSICYAFNSIGGERTKELLTNCLNHNHELVRKWARIGLDDLEKSEKERNKNNTSQEPERITQLWKKISDHTTPIRVRISFIDSIGGIPIPQVDILLLQVLEDDNEWIRIQAAATLGRRKSVASILAIEKLLSDKISLVREAAAEALAEIGEPGLTTLQAGLQSENSLIRESSKYGLFFNSNRNKNYGDT